jgi:hypothetical protein
VTAVLLVVFYSGVRLLPRFVHAVASRSLYNYRERVNRAVARGDYDGAVAIIERASRVIPRDIYFERPEFMYDRIGRIRQQQGHTADALDAFLRAQAGFFRNIQLRGYYPTPRLIHDIIEAYFEMGNPAGAYNEARLALDLYPQLGDELLKPHSVHMMEDPSTMRDLGLLEFKRNMIISGRGRLRQSLVRDPRLVESHFWLGRSAQNQGLLEEALAEYEAELVNCPYSENAFDGLLTAYRRLNRDTAPIIVRRDEMRAKAIAQHVSDKGSTVPLRSFWGVGDKLELPLDPPQPGRILLSILAGSTPCYDVWGWLEVRLDGQHVQTLYVDSREPLTYCIWLKRVESGHHVLTFEDLSDATDGKDDRNVFIYNVRVYRGGSDSM